MGNAAMSEEAVQPSLGRLGVGEGCPPEGALEDERGEMLGVVGWEMNGAAATRGRVLVLVKDERRSDGGGAGVGGNGSG